MPAPRATYLDSYPTFHDFELAYNPDLQVYAVCNPDRCFGGRSPTLADVARRWGTGEAVSWVLSQIYKYQSLAYNSARLKEETFTAAARYLCAQYFWLKCSEVILFFGYCTLGKYDEYVGNRLDVPAVMKALQKFVGHDRANYLAKLK